MLIWSDQGGWLPEEEVLLLSRFGDDTTLDIVRRSPVDPTIVIAWVQWDRLHPSIYAIDFKERTKYDTIGGEEFMSLAAILASERWGAYFPAEQAGETAEASEG